MMLGREGLQKPSASRLDVIFDPIPITGRTIGVRQTAFFAVRRQIPNFLQCPLNLRHFILINPKP